MKILPWFRFYHEALDDPKVQTLEPSAFKAAFLGALQGEATLFSKHLKPGSGDPRRLPAREWAVLRTRVFKRDGYTCRYCGSHGGRLECDHKKPVSRGGSNHPRNLITACFTCNRSKRSKALREWLNA